MKQKLYGAIIALMMSGVLLITTTTLGCNHSQSLPDSFFLITSWIAPKKGDYAAISGHETAYYKKAHFVKKIVGVSGDEVSWQADCLHLNGKSIAKAQPTTKQGDPLTPIKSLVIPKGFVFVLAPHDRSFDSRYQEFGLVPLSNIQGRAFGFAKG